jgi:hypothetical protein
MWNVCIVRIGHIAFYKFSCFSSMSTKPDLDLGYHICSYEGYFLEINPVAGHVLQGNGAFPLSKGIVAAWCDTVPRARNLCCFGSSSELQGEADPTGSATPEAAVSNHTQHWSQSALEKSPQHKLSLPEVGDLQRSSEAVGPSLPSHNAEERKGAENKLVLTVNLPCAGMKAMLMTSM